ncbi:unnamed protein product [Timema podura]|uniref:tRNA synthetases class I catalytic domain-containing protein n=1 Tax=Timema podura TaxID=61482 RepID=A0ABN7PB64_TIMPD|nr:unnamed protein product [Timema podura]
MEGEWETILVETTLSRANWDSSSDLPVIISCYMKFDIIRRILCNHFNINVIMVMGITDIDDKIIHRAAELGEDINTLTRRFEAEFHEDMAKLNIKPATIITRVTDFVPRIISFVQEIVDKGNGYVTVDGWYTSMLETALVAACSTRYGKLFPVSMDEEPAQPMVDKKSPLDFALWKGAKPNEPSWLSPWGPECGRYELGVCVDRLISLFTSNALQTPSATDTSS